MYAPLEERKTFYVKESYPEILRLLVTEIYTEPSFFRAMPPATGGIESVKEMDQMGLELFICTSPLNVYKGWKGAKTFTILQGEDMGVPSRLNVSFTDKTGESVSVSGEVRHIE